MNNYSIINELVDLQNNEESLCNNNEISSPDFNEDFMKHYRA